MVPRFRSHNILWRWRRTESGDIPSKFQRSNGNFAEGFAWPGYPSEVLGFFVLLVVRTGFTTKHTKTTKACSRGDTPLEFLEVRMGTLLWGEGVPPGKSQNNPQAFCKSHQHLRD